MRRLLNAMTMGLMLALFLIVVPTAWAEYSPTVQKYIDAYEANDGELRYGIVAMSPDAIPAEIDALLEMIGDPEADQKFKDTTIYTAELIATTYKDVTGGFEPLRKVKKVQFEMRISTEVVSTADGNGVHTVLTPISTEEHSKLLQPR